MKGFDELFASIQQEAMEACQRAARVRRALRVPAPGLAGERPDLAA